MSRGITQNPAIQAGLRRLRAMGLAGDIVSPSPTQLIIMITGESIARYVARRVSQAFNWPKAYICYDREEGVLIAYFWQGSKPGKVEELERRCPKP